MKRHAGWLIALAGVLSLASPGCILGYGEYVDVEPIEYPTQQVHQTFYRQKGFDPAGKRIAVFDFKAGNAGVGQVFADTLAASMFSLGMNVVERQNITRLIEEYKYAADKRTKLTDSQILRKIGRMSDVDIIVVGGVVDYEEKVGRAAAE